MKKIILSAVIIVCPLYPMHSTSYDADEEDSYLNKRQASDTTFCNPRTISLIESYLRGSTLTAKDANTFSYPDLEDATVVYTQDRLQVLRALHSLKKQYNYYALPSLFSRLQRLKGELETNDATIFFKHIPIQDKLQFQVLRLHQFDITTHLEKTILKNRKRFKKAVEQGIPEKIITTGSAPLYSEKQPFVDLSLHIWEVIRELNTPANEDVSD